MNDIDVEGQFVYTDGTEVDYVDWHPLNPNNILNQDCVYLFKAGTMVDVACYHSLRFMCKCTDCYVPEPTIGEPEIELN